MSIAAILASKGTEVATISGDAPMSAAVAELGARKIGALLVIDSGEVSGPCATSRAAAAVAVGADASGNAYRVASTAASSGTITSSRYRHGRFDRMRKAGV